MKWGRGDSSRSGLVGGLRASLWRCHPACQAVLVNWRLPASRYTCSHPTCLPHIFCCTQFVPLSEQCHQVRCIYQHICVPLHCKLYSISYDEGSRGRVRASWQGVVHGLILMVPWVTVTLPEQPPCLTHLPPVLIYDSPSNGYNNVPADEKVLFLPISRTDQGNIQPIHWLLGFIIKVTGELIWIWIWMWYECQTLKPCQLER